MKIYKGSKKKKMRQAGNGTVSLLMVSRGQEQAQRHSYVVLDKNIFKLSGFSAYLHVIPHPCPAYVVLKNCQGILTLIK